MIILRNKLSLFLLVIILFSNSTLCLADSEDNIFYEINQKYPIEISTIQMSGATEANIIAFIKGFNQIIVSTENLTEDNVEDRAANVIMTLYLSGEHSCLFDAVFYGWNLNSDKLIYAYEKSGADGVISLLPECFLEMGRLIKKTIFPSSDINGDSKVDIYDLIIVSKFIGLSAETKYIPIGIDQNTDQIIDINDLIKVAVKYGGE